MRNQARHERPRTMANTAEAWQAGAINGHNDEPRPAGPRRPSQPLNSSSTPRRSAPSIADQASSPLNRSCGPAAPRQPWEAHPCLCCRGGWSDVLSRALQRLRSTASRLSKNARTNPTRSNPTKTTEKKVKTSRAISRNRRVHFSVDELNRGSLAGSRCARSGCPNVSICVWQMRL